MSIWSLYGGSIVSLYKKNCKPKLQHLSVAVSCPGFSSKTVASVNSLPLSFHTRACSRLWAFQSTVCLFQPLRMGTNEGIKDIHWRCGISLVGVLVKAPQEQRELQWTQHGGIKALRPASPEHSGSVLWVPLWIFLFWICDDNDSSSIVFQI